MTQIPYVEKQKSSHPISTLLDQIGEIVGKGI